jgi:hypothetical protein
LGEATFKYFYILKCTNLHLDSLFHYETIFEIKKRIRGTK